jgi:hypothetical protein
MIVDKVENNGDGYHSFDANVLARILAMDDAEPGLVTADIDIPSVRMLQKQE